MLLLFRGNCPGIKAVGPGILVTGLTTGIPFGPSVEVVTTGDILKMGKSDGLLKESQIEKMWELIKFKRAKSVLTAQQCL